MFEFLKVCREVEALDPMQRGMLIAQKAADVVSGLSRINLDHVDAVKVLAAFIVGSAVSDGGLSEKDYRRIYPALAETLGHECDLSEVKQIYKAAKDVKKEIKRYTEELMSIVAAADEELGADIITLCLLITAVDGKISIKEREYIRKLCKK